jgi:hypothetical protein
VAKNLFADGTTVISDSGKSIDTRDGYNVNAWKYLSEAPSALAYCRTWSGGPIVNGFYSAIESDVSYNTNWAWSTSGGNYDVQSVATHELGHTIGLGDIYSSTYGGTLPPSDPRTQDYEQVMNLYDGPQRTLGNGDKAGAQALYGYCNPLDKIYMIVSKNSGKYLDVYGGLLNDGANIIQWPYHGGDNQIFIFRPVGGEDGYYNIISKNSGKYLDIYGASLDNGAKVIQWTGHGGNNQKFMLTPVVGDDGYYNIIAKDSGKYLDIYGGFLDSGANVIQWPSHGGDNQKFKLISLSN